MNNLKPEASHQNHRKTIKQPPKITSVLEIFRSYSRIEGEIYPTNQNYTKFNFRSDLQSLSAHYKDVIFGLDNLNNPNPRRVMRHELYHPWAFILFIKLFKGFNLELYSVQMENLASELERKLYPKTHLELQNLNVLDLKKAFVIRLVARLLVDTILECYPDYIKELNETVEDFIDLYKLELIQNDYKLKVPYVQNSFKFDPYVVLKTIKEKIKKLQSNLKIHPEETIFEMTEQQLLIPFSSLETSKAKHTNPKSFYNTQIYTLKVFTPEELLELFQIPQRLLNETPTEFFKLILPIERTVKQLSTLFAVLVSSQRIDELK